MFFSAKIALARVYLGLGIYLSFLPLSSHAKILIQSPQHIQLAFSQIISLNETTITTKKNNKNVKIQVGNKAAAPTIISKNDLPGIPYDHQALLNVIDEIPMGPQVKEKATLYLKNIEHKIDDIKRYQSQEHVEHFYPPMKEAILDIRNTARALYELTKPYHHTLSNTLRKLILQSIALFEIELNKRMEMSVAEKEALSLATKRLYAEQSYMVRQKELQQKLMEHLAKLKQLLAKADQPSPCCYISYAWPNNENREQEYWVQPFLSILYDHLTTAGIRVMMDIRDNKPGDSIYKFMEQYYDGNYIILIGTESLLQKHYSIISHTTQTELSIISDRFEQDQKEFGYSRIYPLLISGSMKASFPEIYDKYHTVRDAREAGYLLMLKQLIDWIYEQRITKVEAAYTSLWRTFNEKFPGLPKDADIQLIDQELNIGYHRQRLDYLKRGPHFQTIQEQDNYSSNVENEVVAKSQGSYLKHNEYDQQFQRPSITPDFVERQGLWDKIVNHFNQSNQQVLTLTTHGLGGIGKTELAKYYYLYPPQPYVLRAWFNAENKEQLYAQYVELAKANGIEFTKELPLQEQAIQVKKWLETQKYCLLIYDNAPSANQIDGLLPEQGGHHILITSRNEMDWRACQRLDIDVMEEQEAIALIYKITGYQEKASLKELVKTLNYLPLALAQAGAYMAENQTSIEDYLKLYQKYQSALMNDKTLARNPKHEPVWVTFNMNFKALEVECPYALLTLKQASWLDASVIPEVLLKTMLKGPQGESVDLLWNDVKKHVRRYSLMRIDREGHQLNMHRLVQDILRDQQSKSVRVRKRTLTQIASCIKSIYPENSNKTMENINMVKLLLPHMEMVSSYIKQYLSESEYIDLNLEFNLGDAYESIGNFIKAKEKLQNDLSIKQKQNKKDQLKTKPSTHTNSQLGIVSTLDHLGDTCSQLAEYKEALKYFQQALAIKRSFHADNHPDIATSLNGIGLVYYRLGKYQEALKCLQQALEIRQSLYTGNHPDTATSLHKIGFVYYRLGKYQEALKYHEQALEIRKSLYIDIHPDIAFSLNDIGLVYYRLGKYQEALNYLQQALEIKQTLYSSHHPYIATSLDNVGLVYHYLGKYQEALKYHKQALEIHQATYSDNHPHIAGSLHHIGSVYYSLGNYPEALKYYEQALKINQNIYLGNHFRIAMTLNAIGEIYCELGHYQEALQNNNQALQMYQSIYPSNHPSIATAFSNIGSAYFNLGEYQKALQYHQQALQIRKAAYTGNHPSVAISLHHIGSVYKELGNYQEALKHYEQALKIGQAFYPNNHPYVAFALNSIGSVDYFLGNYQKALIHHKQALEMYQAAYPGNHSNIAMASSNMGSIYQALGELDKALQYHEQALAMRQAIYADDHPDIATSSNNLGSVYFDLGKINKSMELYERALAIYKNKLPHEHIKITKISNNLGNVFLSLGKYNESKELFEKTLTTIINQFGPQHIFTATVMANLGNTCRLLGDHLQSKKLLEDSLKILKAHYKAENADIARVMGKLALLYGELGNFTKKKEYLEKALNIFKKHLYKNHPDIMKTSKELKKFNAQHSRNRKKDRSKVLGYPLIFLF